MGSKLGTLGANATEATLAAVLTAVGGGADLADLDSGAGTDNHSVTAIGLPAPGGHVVGGTSTDPLRTDPTGTTTQPVSDAGGSLTVDNANLDAALSTLATEATLSSLNAKIVTVDTDDTRQATHDNLNATAN